MRLAFALELVLVVVARLAGSALAEPDRLERARSAADQLRFEEAAALLDEAWRAGSGDPRQVRELVALAGEISATMGDRPAAMRWFALLAAMDPEAALDHGTSPKVSGLLDEARAGLGGARFDVRLRFDRARRIVLARPLDPLGAVAEIRLAGGATGGRELAIPWRQGVLTVELADAHGNVLLRARRVIGSVPAEAPAAATAAPAWYARWPTWAGIAGGLAVTGAGLALWSAATGRELDSLHRESEMHQASEALALERRMQRTAVAAQVAGGAAAIAAAAAVVLWRGERSATVTPLAIDGVGAGAALQVPF